MTVIKRYRLCLRLGAGVCLLTALPCFAHDVVINEVHYDPEFNTALLEFVELYNAGTNAVDISGWRFSAGVTYTFPSNTVLVAHGYAVVAENPTNLFNRYGVQAYGPFEGRLSSDGETLRLRDGAGREVDEVDYGVGFPWPVASAGDGGSMELINPALDNNLGGSWRASGQTQGFQDAALIPSNSPSWRYRLGDSEASNPSNAWRMVGFEEDATWQDGQTSIGFGDGDDNTVLPTSGGWMDGYYSVYLRHTFVIDDVAALPLELLLKVYVDDGCIVWLNGEEIGRFHVSAGHKDYDDNADDHEAEWEQKVITDVHAIAVTGTNILAVHVLNQSERSSDLSFDTALMTSGAGGGTTPTPGRANSVWALGAPPHMRQVKHSPEQPTTNDAITVTAKITDADGIASVTLDYQLVLPGDYLAAYLPLDHSTLLSNPEQELAANPDYSNPANWTTVGMRDDGLGGDAMAGDSIYTVDLPAQASNRTLVRYRITATDAGGFFVAAPLADDPRLNFACFVYNGVPPYVAEKRSVYSGGAPHTYGTNTMLKLPVYTLITRQDYYDHCVAYNTAWRITSSNDGARRKFNWIGTFVYDGEVYDHVRYRLRQRNDRYGLHGKRSWRFRFMKGKYLQACDNYGKKYGKKWRTLNVGKMFDNKDVGNFGLTETLNFHLWNLLGVPAPFPHTFHYRTVKGEDEAPDWDNGQYYGDFQGMFLGFEDYDTRFLDAHALPDGNLYKLKNFATTILQNPSFDFNRFKRHQGRYSTIVANDLKNIRANCNTARSNEWLENHVNLPRWYPYHIVCEAIRHYDFRPADTHLKNRAWFFELFDGYVNNGEVPAYPDRYGRMWVLPHDADASWGPSWNGGEDYPKLAVFGGGGKPVFKREYRNAVREFRDLVWTEEVINRWIDHLGAIIGEFAMADRDRWKNANLEPTTPFDPGYQDFGTMESKVQDMKNFAFVSWSGSTGPDVPSGGRAKHLDDLASAEGEGALVPDRPTIAYTGDTNFPINGLTFTCSAFSDPQGDSTFGALQWRVGEMTDTNSPDYGLVDRHTWEYEPVWTSKVFTVFTNAIHLPASALRFGDLYRVRVRIMDSGHTWSHWSEPVEFRPGAPAAMHVVREHLRVTEIMYNPPGGSDEEFVELHNASTNETLNLAGVALGAGIDFSFTNGTTLPPGGYLVLINTTNETAFRTAYGLAPSVPLTGPYGGKLDNGGETLTIKTAAGGTTFVSFEYDDSRGWPLSPDGAGHSLVVATGVAAERALDYGGNWRASAYIGGSPGQADPDPVVNVVLNELMAHTDYVNPQKPDYDSNDWIEFYNVSASPLTLTTDWYLSDDIYDLRKWQFPGTNGVPARGWIAVDEVSGFHSPVTTGFGLNKAGEDVFLSYLPGDGSDRVADAVRMKGQENTASLGRYPDGGRDWFALAPTMSASNAFPAADLVISEVMFHPRPTAAHPEDNENDEFIEIHNPTEGNVALRNAAGTWRIDGGVAYAFPSNTVLDAGAYVVVVSFDPTNTPARAAFLASYGLSEGGVVLLGPFSGKLSNRGERVALERPQASDDPLRPDDTSWVIVDELVYYDRAPWPEGADGTGLSLRRWPMAANGNSPEGWGTGAGPTPGQPPLPVALFRPRSGSVFFTPVSDVAEVRVDPAALRHGVYKVEFFDSGRRFHETLSTPYYAPLDTLVYEGTHHLHAVVTDMASGTHTSRQSVISVYGPPPPNYYHRMKIAFPGYTRASVLTNFPVLVRLGSGCSGFAYDQFASPAGADLRFADANEKQSLPYEVEEWNTGGDSYVWVRVPELKAGTHIWAYWGDPAWTETPRYVTDGSTWSEGYEGVWHFNGGVQDASSNGHHAVNHGSVYAAGAVSGGRMFDGSDDYVAPQLDAAWYGANADALTVSLWARPDLTVTGTVFGVADGLSITLHDFGRFPKWGFDVEAKRNLTHGATAGQWQHLSLALDNGIGHAYRNGAAAPVFSHAPLTLSAAPRVGYLGGSAAARYYFDGTIDELRVAGASRSADWVWAEHRTVSDAAFSACEVFLGYGGDHDGDGIPDGWEDRYFGSTNAPNGGPLEDWDGDGLANLGELHAGTDPTNALSSLSVRGLFRSSEGLPALDWVSVSNRTYSVQRTAELRGPWNTIATDLPATAPINVYTDSVGNAKNAYYRLQTAP